MHNVGMRRVGALLVMGVLAVSASACGDSGDGGAGVPFELRVVPTEVTDAVVGQRLLLLATVESDDVAPVSVRTDVDGATAQAPDTVTPGTVFDVVVIVDPDLAVDDQPDLVGDDGRGEGNGDRPDPGTVTPGPQPEPGPGEVTPRTLKLTVTGTRDSLQSGDIATITVRPVEVAPLTEYATTLRDLWVNWLADNHPEYDIHTGTQWEPYDVKPNIAVVSYFTWISDDWEMGLTWHVTRPGDDWTRIYLRPRDELAPRHGYQIDSQFAALAGDATPSGEIEPPTEVYR